MQTIPKGFDAANAPNNEEIEKQFAVACMDHAEAYWKLLTAVKPSSLKLTKYDDRLAEDFLHHFPEFDDNARLSKVTDDDLKTATAKHKWRAFMKEWEKEVEDYNFGTLLRSDSTEEYTESNSIFVLRIQFIVFEILRNRRGLNDAVHEQAQTQKA